jgi:hypothetical protein
MNMIYKSESGIKKLCIHAKHLNTIDIPNKNIIKNNMIVNSPNILERKKQIKLHKNRPFTGLLINKNANLPIANIAKIIINISNKFKIIFIIKQFSKYK